MIQSVQQQLDTIKLLMNLDAAEPTAPQGGVHKTVPMAVPEDRRYTTEEEDDMIAERIEREQQIMMRMMETGDEDNGGKRVHSPGDEASSFGQDVAVERNAPRRDRDGRHAARPEPRAVF